MLNINAITNLQLRRETELLLPCYRWTITTASITEKCVSSPCRDRSHAYMSNKQLDRAPLRYRSVEHGPACLARSARSQTIGRFTPS